MSQLLFKDLVMGICCDDQRDEKIGSHFQWVVFCNIVRCTGAENYWGGISSDRDN